MTERQPDIPDVDLDALDDDRDVPAFEDAEDVQDGGGGSGIDEA